MPLQRDFHRAGYQTHGAPVFFIILMTVAIVTACAGSQSANPQLVSNFRGHWFKHHSRIKNSAIYTPPGTVYGSRGSYCYMTHAPYGPGDWPVYSCWLYPADSVSFPDLWQVAGVGDTTPPWFCGETQWSMGKSQAGNPNTVTAVISPSVTGVGNWTCNRLDVVSVTISRGADTGGWVVNYQANGGFTLCGRYCSGPEAEVAGGWSIIPGPTPSVLPTPVPTPTGGGSPWPTAQPTGGLVIYDNKLKKVVSDGLYTYNTVVGAQQNLEAELTEGGDASVSYWSLGSPLAVATQLFTSQQAYDTTPSPSPSANPEIFYWVSGTNQAIVQVFATVNNVPMSALAFYNVEAPAFQSMGATFATPGINNDDPADPYFQLGQTASPFPSVAGITTTIKAVSPSDFGGHYAMNQIYDLQPSPVPSNVTPWPSTAPGENWDDGCWLYNVNAAKFNTAPPDAGPGKAVTYGPTYDSPGEELGGLPTLTGLTLNWLFTDTFLFRPDSTDNTGIWVTIAQRQWSWGGNATKTGPVAWATGSPAPFVSPGAGASSTWLPYWPHGFPLQGENCPSPNPHAPANFRILRRLEKLILHHSVRWPIRKESRIAPRRQP